MSIIVDEWGAISTEAPLDVFDRLNSEAFTRKWQQNCKDNFHNKKKKASIFFCSFQSIRKRNRHHLIQFSLWMWAQNRRQGNTITTLSPHTFACQSDSVTQRRVPFRYIIVIGLCFTVGNAYANTHSTISCAEFGVFYFLLVQKSLVDVTWPQILFRWSSIRVVLWYLKKKYKN